MLRGMRAIHDALTFEALVAFMEENIGIWSIGKIMKDKRKAITPRQWLERHIAFYQQRAEGRGDEK